MVLTACDAYGAGAFNPNTINEWENGGWFCYEVLYADPNASEFVDVPFTITGPGISLINVAFAPAYETTSSNLPTPTPTHPTPAAVPRFTLAGTIMLLF
jgi:hypothetical protein